MRWVDMSKQEKSSPFAAFHNKNLEVHGQAFVNARETRGLTQEGLAKQLCLSVKHIDELEKNLCTIFFSYSHRNQVARKVAAYLAIDEKEAFKPPVEAKEIAIDDEDVNSAKSQEENLQEQSLKTSSLPFMESHSEIKGYNEQADQHSSNASLLADKQNSSSSNQRRLFFYSLVGFCAIGILCIFITNGVSQSSFFLASKPVENVVNQEELITTASKDLQIEKESTSVTVTAPVNPEILILKDSCAAKAGESYQYSNPNPSKPANYVYLIAKEKTGFCIVDAEGIELNADLESGGSKSVYGKPPFVLVPNNLAALEVYYEGNKLWNLPADIKALKLIPKSF